MIDCLIEFQHVPPDQVDECHGLGEGGEDSYKSGEKTILVTKVTRIDSKDQKDLIKKSFPCKNITIINKYLQATLNVFTTILSPTHAAEVISVHF